MQAQTVVKSLTAGNAAAIAASQALAAKGYLTLTANPVVLDTQRRVIITSAGNDSALTWTVIGTTDGGQLIKDVFAGADASAAQSNLDFATVISIYGSGAAAGNVEAGTNTTGSSPWKMFGDTIQTPNMSFDCELSGSATYSVEYTQDPFLAPISPTGASSSVANGPASPNPTAIAFTDLSNKSASAQGMENFVFHAWRLTITTGTGSVSCTGRQAGLGSP